MKEALRWHINSMLEDGEAVPEEFKDDLVLEWHLSARAMQQKSLTSIN